MYQEGLVQALKYAAINKQKYNFIVFILVELQQIYIDYYTYISSIHNAKYAPQQCFSFQNIPNIHIMLCKSPLR